MNGDVVVLNFPFSDLSNTKRRPALVMASLDGEDLILCQITSQAREDRYCIGLEAPDFEIGGLSRSSRIRPNRLFTADSAIVLYRVGRVTDSKLRETRDKLIEILR